MCHVHGSYLRVMTDNQVPCAQYQGSRAFSGESESVVNNN